MLTEQGLILATASSEPTTTTARRILIVDDNRDAAESLAMLLKFIGNETHTAYDGLEAVDAAAAFKPDVILLDIGLPRLDGYEAARRIREQPWGKSMVLVALTGWGQEEDRSRSADAGFNAHIVKPIELPALMKLLAETQPTDVGLQKRQEKPAEWSAGSFHNHIPTNVHFWNRLKRYWEAVVLTAVATLGRPLRLVKQGKYLWRRRHLKRALVEAQTALGERLYATGIDDGELGATISALDERIRRAQSAGASSQALSAKRSQLVLQLAAAALEDDAPLPGAEAEYAKARAAQAALHRYDDETRTST